MNKQIIYYKKTNISKNIVHVIQCPWYFYQGLPKKLVDLSRICWWNWKTSKRLRRAPRTWTENAALKCFPDYPCRYKPNPSSHHFSKPLTSTDYWQWKTAWTGFSGRKEPKPSNEEQWRVSFRPQKWSLIWTQLKWTICCQTASFVSKIST